MFDIKKQQEFLKKISKLPEMRNSKSKTIIAYSTLDDMKKRLEERSSDIQLTDELIAKAQNIFKEVMDKGSKRYYKK